MIAFSELFQGKSTDESQAKLLNNPIRADILANLKTVKIQNNLGKFTLTKENDLWLLVEPRLMPAKQRQINNIIEGLKSSKLTQTFSKDAINLSNYALENPSLSIDLFSGLDEQLKIQIGLINPINNNSYITTNDSNTIFKMSGLKTHFKSYKLGDLIDSSIFSQKLKKVIRFKLYSREFKDPVNILTRGESNWKSKKYRTISKESVEKKLQQIFSIKTYMIIDKENSEMTTLISNYLERPLYKLKVKTAQKEITYRVSSLIKSIPELKLEKRQFFLMKASDKKFTYVIQKKFLKEFYIRYSDLK